MKPQSAKKIVLTLAIGATMALATFGATHPSVAAPRGRRSGTTQSGSATARPTPTPGDDDIQLLSGALGRSLTTAEQAAITTAAQTRNGGISTAAQTFESTVAALFNLTASALQTKIQTYRTAHPGVRNSTTILEGALGITLTDAQKTAITTAMQTRATAIQAAVATYKSTVASALGLTVAELVAKVQAYQNTQASSGGRGGGPGGPGGGGPRGPEGGGPGGPPPPDN